MKVSGLLALLKDSLTDADSVAWSQPTLVMYLNQALLALVSVRPDASEFTTILTLSAGSKQALPADGLRLLSIFRNTNAAGAYVGPIVRHIERTSLDDLNASWMQEAPSEFCQEYWYDERAPRQFWTNPVIAGARVEASLCRVPPTMTSPDDTLPVDDVFVPALREWILYLAWGRDDETSPTSARAADHRNTFFNLLGLKEQADAKSSPKAKGA